MAAKIELIKEKIFFDSNLFFCFVFMFPNIARIAAASSRADSIFHVDGKCVYSYDAPRLRNESSIYRRERKKANCP